MKAVVLLSGGVDSTLALAIINTSHTVDALTIDYGQRHHTEINAACRIARHYHVRHTVAKIDPVLFGGSALTDTSLPLPDQVATEPDATYVPARNTVLLAVAAARAESVGATRIVIGANADDADAYPDCRRDYIEAMRDVLQRGTLTHVWVVAPLLGMTKRDIIDRARELDVPIDLTWSCYRGGDQPCGLCGACQLREQALA